MFADIGIFGGVYAWHIKRFNRTVRQFQMKFAIRYTYHIAYSLWHRFFFPFSHISFICLNATSGYEHFEITMKLQIKPYVGISCCVSMDSSICTSYQRRVDFYLDLFDWDECRSCEITQNDDSFQCHSVFFLSAI